MPFTCTLSGECEEDEYGHHETVAQCRAACQGREVKDVNYIVYAYEPASALLLAPSDRVRVIREVTGTDVPPKDSYNVLGILAERDWWEMRHYPELKAYQEQQLTAFDRLLFKILDYAIADDLPINYQKN